MAEAVESLSTSELRAEVARNRQKQSRSRAMEKAMSMQIVEKGAFTLAAVGVGALEAYKPELQTGLGGVGYLNPALVGIGGAMFFATKGMAKEAGSGLLLAGAAPLLNRLGAKLTETISG